MANKLVYIGFGFHHHLGGHAGYHQIKDYIDYDYMVDCQDYFDSFSKKENIVQKCFKHIRHVLTGHYFIPWFLFKLIWLGLLNDNLIYHFIYSENTLFNYKPFIRRGNKIVCTVHQPFDNVVKNQKLDKRLFSVDAIILVGEAEVDKFKDRYNVPVQYIPHGICTDFYKPEESIEKKHTILTVGNWLRDYDFANKVYQKLLEKDDRIEINIVTNPQNFSKIDTNSRIKFHSGISDEELKVLYCESEVLFLPLIRYTANNSLLEAGATGCNIFISSDYPDNSYIPEEMITLLPMDVDQTVSKIFDNSNNKYNDLLVKHVQKNFSWNVIGQQTRNFLESM